MKIMHFFPKSNKVRGFTLLELLVVISIIGILIALGTAAFSTAQRKGRDARRQGDMKVMQAAFEQYNAQNGSYGTCAAMKGDTTTLPGGAPLDPATGLDYTCSASGGDTYCVCALLDTEGAGNSSDGTSCAFDGGDYFCVKNLQ
jgi:prepilin-type N-terminal cleavage/methylation domain-containing protein